MLFEENPTPEGDASTEEAETKAELEVNEAEESEHEEVTEESENEQEDAGSEVELSLFAEAFGIDENDLDVDDDGKVVLRTKIDGEEGKVKISDLKTSYQKAGHLDNENREVVKRLGELATEREQARQQHAERLQQAELAIHEAANLALGGYTPEYMNELLENDSDEYLKVKHRIETQSKAFTQRLSEVQEQQKALQSQQYQESLKQAEKALVETFPEWSDESVGKEAIKNLREYSKQYGFNDQEASGIIDARVFKLLEKAKKIDDLEKSKPELKKKVVKVAKRSKPGGQKTEKNDKSLGGFLYG